jgi:hypothetical protein
MKMRTSVEPYLGCRIVGNEERGRHLKAADGVSDVPLSAGAREGGTEKLYVIMHKGEFCYIGRTEQSVAARIRQGMIASYPYRWRRWDKVDLYVCLFDRKGDLDFGEGVEAELVYLVRQGTRQRPGRWPVDQHEIHFRHRDGVPDPACLKAARHIFRELVTGLRSR